MPVARFQMEDGRVARFEVPDGTTPEQAHTMMQQHFSQPQGDKLELAQEPGIMDNLGAGIKKGVTDMGQGIGQALGITSREDVANTRAQDQELMGTTSGRIGHALGSAATALPAAFIPGVNTVAGGALIGAGLGALQPSTSTAETLSNTGFGAVGGGIGAKISQFLASRAANRAARSAALKPTVDAKNAVLKEAQDAGYVVPPQDTNAGAGSQILNAMAGKVKTEQKASVLNQPITNAKAARSIGLPEGDPITVEAIDRVRKQAGKAYEAVRSSGTIKTDGQFQQDLNGIVRQYQSASKDFPELLDDEVTKIVNSANKKTFDADSAIDAIGIMRKKGTAAYRKGESDIAGAYKKSADALENAIGRHLQNSGAPQDLINNFRAARETIAKTYSVEKALNSTTGNVNAQKIGAQLADGKPLTGELKDVGRFAQSYRKSAQDLPGVNPYSVFDMAGAAGGMAINPAITAYVAGRPIVRSLVLNPTYQKMFVKGAAPSNTPTSLMRLGAKSATPLSALAAIKSREDK